MSLSITVKTPTRRLLTQHLLPPNRSRLRLQALAAHTKTSSPRTRTRGLSTSNTNMAKIPTEIPSMNLNDGTSIPMLGYGTGTAWYKSGDDTSIDRKVVEGVKTAIKLGYNHLDGAEVYNTERELGVGIKESKVPRERLFVTSKVYTNIKDIPKAIDTSLEKLQMDYVDLYLIHAPFFASSDAELQTAWAAMETVKKSGKARSIGVSNYLEKHLAATLATATIPPSINQIEYHPYLQHGNLLEYQTTQTIAASAYGPLTVVTKAKPGPVDDVMAQLAKKYYVSEGEVALRWVMDQGVVAITTSGKEERLSDYMRAMTFTLTPREVKEISDAGAGKHFRGFWQAKFDKNDRS